MKKILTIAGLLLMSVVLHAQKLMVESFKVATNDLSARTQPRKDLNDDDCALVKVELAASGASFEGFVVGNVKYMTSEYYVYMPQGSKRLTVKLEGYLPLQVTFSDYGINSLVSKTTYQLILQLLSNEVNTKNITPYIKGIPLKMIYVEGGSFAKPDGTKSSVLNSFYMSETEITNELWESVMGNSKSHFEGKKKPIVNVSWEECSDFIAKVKEMTGLSFRLPTETEWEYAARGGEKGHGYKYAGSNTLDDIACYNKPEGPDDVAKRNANELGIYDMNGNVWEWCNNSCDGGDLTITGTHLSEYAEVVARGGGWYSKANRCSIESRACHSPTTWKDFIGFRLIMDKIAYSGNYEENIDNWQCNVSINEDSIILTMDNLRIPFVHVKGGTFLMGATPEQKEMAAEDEYPVHKVELNDYYMSTEKLCLPAPLIKKLKLNSDEGESFTYSDAKTLIELLSEKSKLSINLPTESEWEYAARGGQKSKKFIYSGTNDADIEDWSSPMTTNELGLIGMSEGKQEWTSDSYSVYNSKQVNDFAVEKIYPNMVVRGGERRFGRGRRRVSARNQSSKESQNAIRLVIVK